MGTQSPRRLSHKACAAQGGANRVECDNPQSEGGTIPISYDWDEVTCDDCLRVLAQRRAKMDPAYWERRDKEGT